MLISAVNSQARLIFNAGREGLLPRWLGKVHPTRRTPVNAIFAFIAIATVIILVWALLHLVGGAKQSGQMSALNFFVDSSTMGTILVLVVYFLANLALPFYYRKYRPQEFNVLKHAVLPVLGMIAVGVPMYYLVKPGQAVAAQLVPVRGARRDRRVRRLRLLGEPPGPGAWRPGRLDRRRRVAGRRLPAGQSGRTHPSAYLVPHLSKGRQPMTANPHPLDPATAGEYLAGREIMAAAGLLADPVRFAYYGLEEPPKDEVLGSAWPTGRGRPTGGCGPSCST